jgi:hypothetical protein
MIDWTCDARSDELEGFGLTVVNFLAVSDGQIEVEYIGSHGQRVRRLLWMQQLKRHHITMKMKRAEPKPRP